MMTQSDSCALPQSALSFTQNTIVSTSRGKTHISPLPSLTSVLFSSKERESEREREGERREEREGEGDGDGEGEGEGGGEGEGENTDFLIRPVT
jgi:hypothetical protein